jgi:RNA polymerase sigma factor (TIGR02999 family)
MASPSAITLLLQSHADGDPGAAERLFPLIYRELQRLARRQLGSAGRPGATLGTTALVHEAYLKLLDPAPVTPRERAHFFALVARAMRQIIIDHARRNLADKRGGGAQHVQLDESRIAIEDNAESLFALDQSLQRLAVLEPRLVQVVECRFFAGLSEEETAEALDVGLRTVQRDWLRARDWLKADLGHGE